MEITSTEGEKIRATWQERLEKRNLERERLRREASLKTQILASWLKSKWKVARVYLYGSLAGEGHFDHLSDIDLYVTGFPVDQDYWRMLAEGMELARPFPLSIVLEEDALPSLRQKVLSKGRLL